MCAKIKSSKKSNNKKSFSRSEKKTNHFLQNTIAWENHSDEKKIDMWIFFKQPNPDSCSNPNSKSWSKKFEISNWNLTKWCFKIGLDGYILKTTNLGVSLQDLKKPENIDANLNCNQSKSGKYFYVRIGERKTTKTRNQNRTFCIWPFNRDF